MSGRGTVYVRRDVWSLAPDDPIIDAYTNAVKRMRERPPDDPTSWTYQAAMHGTHAKPNKPEWNGCQHGTWFFLPWHRMFLFFFERIVRAAVAEGGGPADWALPYWNYGVGGERAELPLAFRSPTLPAGEPNPLCVAERAAGMNNGKGTIPEGAGSPAKALDRPQFIGKAEFGGDRTEPAQFSESGGEVEETPHNVRGVLDLTYLAVPCAFLSVAYIYPGAHPVHGIPAHDVQSPAAAISGRGPQEPQRQPNLELASPC